MSPAIYSYRRRTLEQWIDRAIALLDQIDGDPDYEDDEREDDPAELGIADMGGWIE